ncbi:2-oxoacid:acceptor oxidoreductase subunit alpha [Candidatus Dojkabacteria bacterium]|uniref:2-oxoacid:acceptor oxidoreductase subunit alpha n=1 Tax=Candidatus Dojkabacteria bacterium TaxID=2099670 RepID=A0A955RKI8_9BACT|nr:2-oxoacid:acceptor oxidoreductase subunit alpha [Candidatus Dojkabacteria bacterium]
MKNTRLRLKIAGESGQGVNSVGELLAKACKRSGYFVFGYREYPSLIKGGYANYQIDIAAQSIQSSSKNVDIAVCLSRRSVHEVLDSIDEGGVLIHWVSNFHFSQEEEERIRDKAIHVEFIDVKKIITEHKGKKIMVNTFFIGLVWGMIKQDFSILEQAFKEEFGKRRDILDKNIELLSVGFEYQSNIDKQIQKIDILVPQESQKESLLLSGNQAIALGAIASGVRAYYAYPMTPASSILSYLSKTYHSTGILVKQAEDEITAAQMTLGSMHMGTRALVATSGGGFDLMTETLSLAMITEIPFVCVVAQRPGPATGVPTWTAAADLNLALYAGHGESSRCVLAASDVISAYTLTQHAFNIAERYQIPVILLTEKQIAESLFNCSSLPEPIEIERGLTKPDGITASDRFKLTETGVSPRWLPGQSDQTYNANSDEHVEHGKLTERADDVRAMMEKRMKKQTALLNEFPDPILYGEEEGDMLFVGWGSPKNTMVDVISYIQNGNSKKKISYLHYEYIYPLKAEWLLKLSQQFKKSVVVEQNYQSQFGKLVRMETGFEFNDRLLKYDGRPFFIEDILDYISE